jgi:hypothetical protein
VARAKQVDLQIEDLAARAHMEIISEGKKRERVFDLFLLREGVNYRAVLSLREPPEMSGTRFLVVAERGRRNRQWAYFPDLELVRRIAGRNEGDPFLGSDLTYVDLAGGAHIDDLRHRLVGEEDVDGVPCYLMEGVPRRRTFYGKLRGWVRKDNFVTVRAVFFDDEGVATKEAHLGELREVDEIPLIHRVEVKSLVTDSRTVLTLSDVRLNQGLKPEHFTESALETGDLPGSSPSRFEDWPLAPSEVTISFTVFGARGAAILGRPAGRIVRFGAPSRESDVAGLLRRETHGKNRVRLERGEEPSDN